MNKRYIIKDCQNKFTAIRHYEAHYSNGDTSQLFTVTDYRTFLKFTEVLKEAGYKYIENEEEY